jgi:hypothetical protein
MAYHGATRTKFGRYQVGEPLRLETLHFHLGEPLVEVDHEPPVPVLDQEDLLAQGIRTSELVPGAPDVDALGSCTCNAGTVSLAEHLAGKVGPQAVIDAGLSLTDAVANEKFAIKLYHSVTWQTGDPSQEWPPTDCGSTGLYVCHELETQGLIKGHKAAHDAHGLVSLLQVGTVIMGSPWFNAWMEPNADGFVDGDGTIEDLKRALESGVAGGHETCVSAAERLTWATPHRLDLENSSVRVRNSWGSSWGDKGSYRIHLSTLQRLAGYVDYKAFVV